MSYVKKFWKGFPRITHQTLLSATFFFCSFVCCDRSGLCNDSPLPEPPLLAATLTDDGNSITTESVYITPTLPIAEAKKILQTAIGLRKNSKSRTKQHYLFIYYARKFHTQSISDPIHVKISGKTFNIKNLMTKEGLIETEADRLIKILRPRRSSPPSR